VLQNFIIVLVYPIAGFTHHSEKMLRYEGISVDICPGISSFHSH
jgi:hypothetical protein